MVDLTGKVALITGGARRVGRAIAEHLAERGMVIAVHYRNSVDAATDLVKAIRSRGGQAECFAAELTAPGECHDLVNDVVTRFSGVDLLVNNAAVFVQEFAAGESNDAWERAWRLSLQVNLVAPARLARLCTQTLTERRGAIVNLCDIAGHVAWEGYAHHGASKAGLAHLTRCLAVELGPAVRVNAVAPGIAQFPDGMETADRQALIAKTSLKRAGDGADVAQAVGFLASHDYISGIVLPVDGGWSVPR